MRRRNFHSVLGDILGIVSEAEEPKLLDLLEKLRVTTLYQPPESACCWNALSWVLTGALHDRSDPLAVKLSRIMRNVEAES